MSIWIDSGATMEVKKQINTLITGIDFLNKTKRHLQNSCFVGIIIFNDTLLFPLTYNYEHKHLVIREWPGILYADNLFSFSANSINNSICQTYETF